MLKLTTLEGEPAYIDPAIIRAIIQLPELPAATIDESAMPRRSNVQLAPIHNGWPCVVLVTEEADDIEAMRQAALAKTEEA